MTSMQASDSHLKMCKKCNTPKQALAEVFDKKIKVSIMCECEKEAYEKEKEEQIKKEKMLKLQKLRDYSLMNSKFDNCTFENFEVDEVNKRFFNIAKRYTDKFNEMKKENLGLLLHGSPGTGKTFLAFCIANELINRLIPVVAISSIGLLGRIKESYKKYGNEGEATIINSLRNASLLILDDLGAENSTPWAKEKIYEIIDARNRDEKPIIITTNLSLNQLKSKMTSSDGVHRTHDRIVEMCTPIEIQGKPRRIESAKEKQNLLKELLK